SEVDPQPLAKQMLLTVALSLCGSFGMSPMSGGQSQQSGKVETLAADLRSALQRSAGSYQRFFRDSFHAATPALDGKEWSVVEKPLRAQAFKFEELPIEGSTRKFAITLPGVEYQTTGGWKHTLTIKFHVYPDVSRTVTTKMIVRTYHVGLQAEVG